MSVNFGFIGNIISNLFDSDYIDIKRNQFGKLQEVYSNIPCHISYNSTDNPDSSSVDIKPIIQSITVNLPNWVDVRNDDFIVAKKMNENNELMAVYSGRCGNPVVSQSRKKFIMNMQGTEIETPTPTPPQIEDPSKITINYLYDNNKIHDSLLTDFEKGKIYSIEPLKIEGYEVSKLFINGIEQEETYIELEIIDDEYIIDYQYEASNKLTGFRYLVNGLYTSNDGSLRNGFHLYKDIKFDSISEIDNKYIITCDNKILIHKDSGLKLSIQVGRKLVLTPSMIFVIVDEIIKTDEKITFSVSKFEPNEEEKSAYVTRWYDGS